MLSSDPGRGVTSSLTVVREESLAVHLSVTLLYSATSTTVQCHKPPFISTHNEQEREREKMRVAEMDICIDKEIKRKKVIEREICIGN